jgi:O-antigen/teichoic acid export membrane protein
MTSVTRNITWNFLGALLPIPIALISIPLLIHTLGDEKFGLLAIAWLISAYFVLSDFGVGVATKKYVASAHIDNQQEKDVASLIWSSILIHTALGLVGGFILLLISPWLLKVVFDIPTKLIDESLRAFLWLSYSIPILLITSCFRNLLEAYHRFDLVNFLKIPASSINFLIPIIFVSTTTELDLLMLYILISRVIVLFAHVVTAIKVIPNLRKIAKLSFSTTKKLFQFGYWVTLSSLINTTVLVSDRFLVTSIFSVAAVTYYVTPYEVVTKMWIISASVLGALFPVLASTQRQSTELISISKTSFIVLSSISAILIAFIVIFSRDILDIWIGPAMVLQGGTVMKWLALGIYFSILCQLPSTVLQATGNPESVTKIQLSLLFPFLILAYTLSHKFGSVGIAASWCLRQIMEFALIYNASNKWTSKATSMQRDIFNYVIVYAIVFIGCCWFIEKASRSEPISIRLICYTTLLAIYVFASMPIFKNNGAGIILSNLYKKYLRVF